jgi:hypothetical protein
VGSPLGNCFVMFLKRVKMPQTKNLYLTKENKHNIISVFFPYTTAG